jgi:hypothetical protein
LEAQIEGWWREKSYSRKEGQLAAALVCLSVRSGLDLVLSCLALPRGSEVIMSAVTISHMVSQTDPTDPTGENLEIIATFLPTGAHRGAPWACSNRR